MRSAYRAVAVFTPCFGVGGKRMSRKTVQVARGAVSAVGKSTNLALVRGRLVALPTVRVVDRHQRATTFDLASTVKGRRVVVPVVALNMDLPVIKVGDEVTALGYVRRRFFRVGPRTQSVTELVVEHIASGKNATKIAKLFAALSVRCKEARVTTLPTAETHPR